PKSRRKRGPMRSGRYASRLDAPSRLPFLRGDLPYFSGKTAGDMVLFNVRYNAHALLFRDAPRADVGNCFGHTHDGKLQLGKPVVVNGIAGLAHQSLAVPLGSDPETSVFVLAAHETDASDNPVGIVLLPQGPMPGLTTSDGGQRHVPIKGIGAVRREGPGNAGSQVTHDLPLRKKSLDLLGIGQFQRTQHKAWCFELGSHILPPGPGFSTPILGMRSQRLSRNKPS